MIPKLPQITNNPPTPNIATIEALTSYLYYLTNQINLIIDMVNTGGIDNGEQV